MSVDFNRVGMLLMVVEKISTVAPQMTSILGAAMAEIKDMNDEAAKEAAKVKAEADKKAAEEKAKADAEAKAKADAEAKVQPKVLETVERKV